MPKLVEYQVVVGPDFKAVEEALRAIDKSLPSKFRDAMRQALEPAVNEAKKNVLAIPTHGPKHTGLRARVAKGVKTVASPGGSDVGFVRVITTMPKDEAIIPRGMDRQEGWRHPVFGNKNVWVTQHTGGSWFRVAMSHAEKPIKEALHKALEDAARFVDDAGD